MAEPAGDASWVGVGLYSFVDASRLIRIPVAKLRRLVDAYWFQDGSLEQFLGPAVGRETNEPDERVLTFLELIELFFIGFLRMQGVSLQVILAVRRKAQREFGVRHAFAVERLDADGRDFFVRGNLGSIEGLSESQILVELSHGRLAFEKFARPFLQTVDFENGSAWRYWPLGRDQPVVVDAKRAFGKPITLRGSIPTLALQLMVASGQSPQSVALWYDLDIDSVKAAVDYEETHRLAA